MLKIIFKLQQSMLMRASQGLRSGTSAPIPLPPFATPPQHKKPTSIHLHRPKYSVTVAFS